LPTFITGWAKFICFKALDANFKLGKLYNELGDKKRARELLQRAAQGTGATASKAKSYLESNF
jgi:hypothetical protein